MDPSGLRRKDTTKGPPLRILSLDGGGVRGYSMFILLQELMHKTYVEIHGTAPKRQETPKPCDHFDLIAGTGTGGLIAIMLGRLRLDLETCKDVYTRMTKRVFETDKTIAGIPYRSTLFKASKLEEAIRACVREHTVFENEGNDNVASPRDSSIGSLMSPNSIAPPRALSRSVSNASKVSGMSPIALSRWGNPDALLYDTREDRTKTAVTAVYQGTTNSNSPAALLRSYDSRKEPSPEFNCTIWQAGRATSATGVAFKPIQIGQSIFIDEGAGRFNPAPQILDEAAVNEWPGREVGVFVSIGTGKRPPGTNNEQEKWWAGFVGGGMGDWAEARRRLIAKIEGCEDTHQYMLREGLAQRNVDPQNYFRLNVEVGVGEFGMNEWNRLADINTNTIRYLKRPEVEAANTHAAIKLGRIHRMKMRQERAVSGASWDVADDVDASLDYRPVSQSTIPEHRVPHAASSAPYQYEGHATELPADISHQHRPPPNLVDPYPRQYQRKASEGDKFAVLSPADLVSDEYPQSVEYLSPNEQQQALRYSGEYPPSPYRVSSEFPHRSTTPPSRQSMENPPNHSPPPIPPKTPLTAPEHPYSFSLQPPRSSQPQTYQPRPLPYPDTDGPPPPVNMARKPEYGVR